MKKLRLVSAFIALMTFTAIASAEDVAPIEILNVPGGVRAECDYITTLTGVEYEYAFKMDDWSGSDLRTQTFIDVDDNGIEIYSNTFTVISSDGVYFTWNSIDDPIGVVLSKGGPGGLAYAYPADILFGTDLHSPVNRGGNVAAISHISFCWNPPVPDECVID